jgi:hypothetical protein
MMRLGGAELKARRTGMGWSQGELARRAGVHVQTVKYWERRTSRAGCDAYPYTAAFEKGGLPAAPANVKAEPCLCGERTRTGRPCIAKPVPGKKRCRNHGGLSTGPRTAEGRERIGQAQRKRWG